MIKKSYSYKRELKQNPYTGFTSFQHFGTDVLYSDLVVKPENNMTETEHVECYPIPDYVEEKGSEQGYYPESPIVYIRILWKEFEPVQGEYNYAFVEDIMNKARESGQGVMFRLMPHSTRESDDVPDWVRTLVDCPARPEGMRIKESPSDPKFLRLFEAAVVAFARRFDSDPVLEFIDISLPGSWGEGSSCGLFSDDDLKRLTDTYTSEFKNTLIIGQVTVPWLVNYANESTPVGWRADCIGESNCHVRVTGREAQMPEVWRRGHVSFESYWWLGEWKRKGWNIDDIIADTLKWHISTFNAKSLPIPYEWKDKIDAWIAKMGYHFVIREAELAEKPENGCTELKLTVENVGVAPIYRNIPLYVRLKTASGEKLIKTDTDIRNWLPGVHTESIKLHIPEDMRGIGCSVQIGIGGGDEPCIYFATDAEQDGHFAYIAEAAL